MSGHNREQRARRLGTWENRLYDLMREIEEVSHLVGASDLHSLVRLGWREASRTREAEEAAGEADHQTPGGTG